MKKIISWIIVVLIIIGYLTVVHRVNNKENIIKREPKSIFKADDENLQATITIYPTLGNNNTYTSTNNNLASFSVNYPDNWSVHSETTNDISILTLQPAQPSDKSCIKIYQTKDNMPLLEAVNYSRFMQQKKDTPYVLKEAVETTIDKQPTYISKLQLTPQKPDEFVWNAVIVKDTTYTTIVRACPGTNDKSFFAILRSMIFQ